MARRFHRKESLSAMSEINVTPLIDLAFALLIIFMITTPLLEQSIDIILPSESPKTESKKESDTYQTISIDKTGQIFWGTDPVTLDELKSLVENLSSLEEPPVITIRGDRRLQYQQVITVVDLIKQNKLTRISLDTLVE